MMGPNQSLTTGSDGIHKSTHRIVMATSAKLGAGLQLRDSGDAWNSGGGRKWRIIII